MLTHQLVRKFLWIVPLLLTTLACNTATQWTQSPIFTTTDPASPSSSTTATGSDAACTALLPDILDAAMLDDVSDDTQPSFHSSQQVGYLVVYNLIGDRLGTRDDLILPADLDQQIDSRASHEAIWSYFTSIIPSEERAFVSEFSILSDGRNNILAGVSPTFDDPNQWTLKVDVVDADNPYILTYSLLHEYGHLLTLNASQVSPDAQVFYHPDDQSLYDQSVASCPRYFTGEGCSNSGSYINEFYNRFWSSFYAEWEQSNQGQDIQLDLPNQFYHDHEDHFLTSYAATSPQEDIAESWVYFVLSPKPERISIANQKILFFYEYPELVVLRQEILNKLCISFPNK